MKSNQGDEESKARDLFYALWIPDLFMTRVEQPGAMWSLFCPHECPGLSDVWGPAFDTLYTRYESEGKARKQVLARDLWYRILDSHMETGTPYMLFKDAVNRKSNYQHIGTIRSSNLCTEIMQYSDEHETAVCNLASLGLPRFLNATTGVFDFAELERVVHVLVRNLNRIIDINHYPNEKCRRSNVRHRPMGLGVQGLADVFLQLRIPFCSEEAQRWNRDLFETMYYAALCESCRLAELEGPYPAYAGSPASLGFLQFDLWNQESEGDDPPHIQTKPWIMTDTRHPWSALKARIAKYGLRNAVLLAPMPTASTSQVFGYSECMDPYTSNMFARRTLAGEYVVWNDTLIRTLLRRNAWTPEVKEQLLRDRGSVQQLDVLTTEEKELFKTVWEMPMKTLLKMSADRGRFIDQSQSMNVYLSSPTYEKLTLCLMYAWKQGLKTGMYYQRRRVDAPGTQFALPPPPPSRKEATEEEEKEEECLLCSA